MWNEKKLPEDERWEEIFRNFKQVDIPLKILAIIEFLLSLAGKNAAVGCTGE
jgi:hypothetical protein